jgi:hypothetical protein
MNEFRWTPASAVREMTEWQRCVHHPLLQVRFAETTRRRDRFPTAYHCFIIRQLNEFPFESFR